MKNNITKKQLKEQQLVHKHAGNGWGMVEDIDSEFCRIMGVLGGVGTQAFLAAKCMLEPERREVVEGEGEIDIMIKSDVLEQLTEYRSRIISGTHRVKETRIVPA